jgi:hypothetical protein
LLPQVLTRQEPWAELESAETEIGFNVRDGERPELLDASDWRKASASAAALAPCVDACWAQEHTTRPSNPNSDPNPNPNPDPNPNPNPNPNPTPNPNPPNPNLT